MPGNIGIWQLVIIIGLVVLLFGAKRLPDTARALGKSLRILKSETSAMKKDGKSEDEERDGAAESTAPRTIQAAPGDVTSSRPVEEPKRTTQG
ncbi:Sec-independent protein translocase subunit TatA [Streptomyces sp. TRM 70351]|uniref:Sec-independent protein translocase subunit TatA n=1 Tax=Streptomyces sp. TRM 70351 TaxID=3116552 RepID=UPI002E7BEDA3|nr:Sec-independent protein translocase subunit TatA [Streptomyces sp. TRM 70351]MEE1929159.1 Sec-independent protein translocase subunit TatA [Streptomyces sp. TRM 70351]